MNTHTVKQKKLSKTCRVILGLSAFGIMTAASSADAIWDNNGSGITGGWDTANNWNPDVLPAPGDVVSIGPGFTVDYDTASQNLPAGISLSVSGTLDANTQGVLRLLGSSVSVSASGELTGNFYDLNGGTLTFDDGAKATMNNFEHKGDNIFNFNLSGSGFTALTPGGLLHGGGATWANATYNIDMAAFTPSQALHDFTLIDAGSNTASNDFHLASVNILNAGPGVGTAQLIWDDTNSDLKLEITQAIPEPSATFLMGFGLCLIAYIRRK